MSEAYAKSHSAPLSGGVLDQLFREARSYNAFEPTPVPEDTLRQLYDLTCLAPTASNGNPARFVFLVSEEAKARLAPHMSSSNKAKTLAAPVNVIVAYDVEFWKLTPRLFPHKPEAASWFSTSPDAAKTSALRNGSLQAAFLIMATRSLGLDCGPMSGFKEDGVNQEFFAGTSWRANFILNIGYGTRENLYGRLPRLPFEEACQLL